MIKLLKGLAVVCVALFAAYFFLIDGIIKAQLEREGSRALQAPLDIGRAIFHLFPTTLTLRDVQVGNARQPTHNLVQAQELSLPLSLRDLLAHKLIVDAIDIHGLRFNRPRASADAAAPTAAVSATRSPQLREALQHVQHMLNHPLASNTLDANASISGAILADEFKPLLEEVIATLNTVAAPVNPTSDWQVFARRINLDGALDFGGSALRFVGTIDNVTPQPQLFDAVTRFDLHSLEGEPATLRLYGNLDKRKLAQAALRFDLNDFPLSQWPLCDDPELKIVVVSASVSIQAFLSLTGNQFDLNALAHFQQVRSAATAGDNEVARIAAEVWRRSDAFDLNVQASGELANPAVKLNSSLDAPLAAALRQLQPAAAFPSATFPNTP